MTLVPSKRHPLWAERQFGRGVGLVVTAIGAWMVWQSPRAIVGETVLTLGALLMLFGFVYPRALVLLNRWWMRLAHALSVVGTRVVLGLVFFVVVTPTGVVRRLTGADPLGRRRSPSESYWVPYPSRLNDRKHFEKMF